MTTGISTENNVPSSKSGRGALLTGGVAAILASTCCIGPLVLLTLVFSGAWISNLTVLEPYRLLFSGVAVAALFFAWKRIWRPAAACNPEEVCAASHAERIYKLLFGVVAVLVFIALGFPYIAPLFY